MAGYACLPGSASATPAAEMCAAGQYSTSGAVTCLACLAGYACPAPGATNGTVAMCGVGKFSAGGASVCVDCDAGYACTAGSTTSSPAACLCPAGRFGATGAVSCTNCSAGYVCPTAGATSATAVLCPKGAFSVSGATTCSDCSRGVECCPAGSRAPNEECVLRDDRAFQQFFNATGGSDGHWVNSSGWSSFEPDSGVEPCTVGVFGVTCAVINGSGTMLVARAVPCDAVTVGVAWHPTLVPACLGAAVQSWSGLEERQPQWHSP